MGMAMRYHRPLDYELPKPDPLYKRLWKPIKYASFVIVTLGLSFGLGVLIAYVSPVGV